MMHSDRDDNRSKLWYKRDTAKPPNAIKYIKATMIENKFWKD